MNRTKIEWADYTWNPIKGICPVGCWYCYARRIYQRFHLDPEVRLDLDELMGPCPNKPSRIFACSTFELFHPAADYYRNNVFHQIECMPEHTFIILTKMPERIDRPMPDHVWLGVTITGENNDVYRWLDLEKAKARVKFISFEPILSPMIFESDHCPEIPAWTIWGTLTGHGKKKAEFDRNLLLDGVRFFKGAGSKVFLKNSLASIWGKPLIQEWPK